jgi:hypothetical protein
MVLREFHALSGNLFRIKGILMYSLIVISLSLVFCCEEGALPTAENDPQITEFIKGTCYYVAVNGNDYNPGTYSQPWATWQKAFTYASAGDTVYIRGGYYKPTRKGWGTTIDRKSGTADKPICIFNYPGERPVFDFEGLIVEDFSFGMKWNYCEYWHIKGLEITNIRQPASGAYSGGIILYDCKEFTLENLSVHNIGGPGYIIERIKGNISLINCDSYNNYDINTPGYHGGNADGFDISLSPSRDARVTLESCRAWKNSDDGFDCYDNEGIVFFKSCWAFENGYDQGDGAGFKLGATALSPLEIPQRVLQYCIAYKNASIGFLQNVARVKMNLFNNIAYSNGSEGFATCTRNEVQERIILRNNLSYNNGRRYDCFESNTIHDHNSWNGIVSLSDNDFITLNPTGIDALRYPDGKLPDTNFLKIAPGSDLINAGIDIGLAYLGISPDLGPFEKE